MNEFFNKNEGSLGILREVFVAKGIGDENFYSLSTEQLQVLFANHGEYLLTFIAQYNLEKSSPLHSSHNQTTIQTEAEIIRTSTCQSQLDDSLNNMDISLPPSNVSYISTERDCTQSTLEEDSVKFKDNELYHLLISTLDGMILLARYKYIKELCMTKLKDMVIYHLIAKDPVSYEIKQSVFAQWKIFFQELFPTENADNFFYPYTVENNQVIGSHGSLYNYYKTVRCFMRDARMLKGSDIADKENTKSVAKNSPYNCLTDPDRSKYSAAEVLESWKNDYEERKTQLTKADRGKPTIRIDSFLNSFTCLKSPLAQSLLEQDFERIISDLIRTGDLQTKLLPSNYLSLFQEKWLATAVKIIKCAQNPLLRNPELKKFLEIHRSLIKQGTRNHIIALSLLPFLIQVVTKVNTGRKIEKPSDPIDELEGDEPEDLPVRKKLMIDESFTITKPEVFNSFILYVESMGDLEAKKKEYTDWLIKLNQPIHPFLVFVGDFSNTNAFIIFKNEDLYYQDPIVALQECFKIHIALRKFPNLSKAYWHFIASEIFKFTHFYCSAFVNSFISKINK